MHSRRKKYCGSLLRGLSFTMLIKCSRIFFPKHLFVHLHGGKQVLWKTFQKYEFWCMPFILQFKWGNKAGNIHATTNKGHKTFCNWCKWWGLRNSAVRAPKMTAYWVHDTPGKLCGGNEIWMGLADRWDLDGQKRVLVGRRRGTLGLEKSRIWVVGGSTVLVLDGSEDGRLEVGLHGSGGY